LLGEQQQQRSTHIPALRSPASCVAGMAAARCCTADRVGLCGEVRMVASLAGLTAGGSMVPVTTWVVIGVHGFSSVSVSSTRI
jgi:hypothetical protein